ncbi:hypothetical protein FACS1894166_08050 [Bacilli bacterium]|nr:hypothetical protein FACS1894166_08050 [Bacilli bacterium]
MANKKQTTTIVKVSQPTKKTSKKKPLKQTTVIKTVVTKEIIQNSRKSGIKKNKQLHHSAVVIKPSNAILGSISNTVNVDKPVSSPTATQVASKGVTTLANNNIRINTSNDIAYAANFDNYYNDFFITCSFIAETDQKTTNKNGDVLPVLFAQFPLMSIEKTYF